MRGKEWYVLIALIPSSRRLGATRAHHNRRVPGLRTHTALPLRGFDRVHFCRMSTDAQASGGDPPSSLVLGGCLVTGRSPHCHFVAPVAS